MKKDKERAQAQYDAFKQLESVGYYFDRGQISDSVAESRTSNREIGRIDMSCDTGTCLIQRCRPESDTRMTLDINCNLWWFLHVFTCLHDQGCQM